MKRLLACLLIAILLVGCSDDTTEPESTPLTITGTVTDADGDPVADAAVVLDLDMGPVVKAAAMPPATRITFDMPEAGAVQFTVLDACRADTFEHQELDLAGGVHSLIYDGTDAAGLQLTDRAMWAVVTTPEATSEIQLILSRNLDDEDGDFGQWDHAYVTGNVRIQATTDADGWFTITDPCVGFGATFTATNEMGEPVGEWEIAWRVRAWAYHADHAAGAASAWRDVDPDDGCTLSVIMDD